jgi:hypothetical protein
MATVQDMNEAQRWQPRQHHILAMMARINVAIKGACTTCAAASTLSREEEEQQTQL